MKLIKYMTVAALGLAAASCTDLNETVYDQVMSDNYYNTREDVLRAAYRPFDHAFVAIIPRFNINEVTGDQIQNCQRDSWFDQHNRHVLHYHTWSAEEGDEILNEWNLNFTGIMQCNYVIRDLNKLDPAEFGFTQAEFDNLIAQNRALRCWFLLKLLDAFRNIPLPVTADAGLSPQVEPKVVFEYIESELKDCIPGLVKKEALGTQSNYQTRWTQGSAAALLVRLYLNAEPYIGEDRYDDCAKVAQDILDGVYGQYQIADRWDAPFDYNNDTCDEVMYGFTSKKGYPTTHYSARAYFSTVPARARRYLNDYESSQYVTETVGGNTHYPKFAAMPSYDLNGELYTTSRGMAVQKYRKYPGDYRLTCYRNIPNEDGTYTGKHEGFFLYGELPSINTKEGDGPVPEPGGTYTLYIRDAVGKFKGLKPDEWPTDKNSVYNAGDHNSGWHFVKYPLLPDGDPYQFEADYTEIRLAEVVYSLAECKLRRGDTDGAATLLNSVRRRNYPSENLADALYAPEGKAALDLEEMLDEWGREFFGEGRRRIDLVRFKQFSQGEWWDKKPDADNHTDIFPLMRATLNSNHYLKQNPGYGN